MVNFTKKTRPGYDIHSLRTWIAGPVEIERIYVDLPMKNGDFPMSNGFFFTITSKL